MCLCVLDLSFKLDAEQHPLMFSGSCVMRIKSFSFIICVTYSITLFFGDVFHQSSRDS